MSQVSGGVKASMYLPNFPIPQPLSGREVQRQSCSAETLWFVLPTVWCQTLCDPNEGREEKKNQKNWENKLNRRQYITLSK